MIASSTLSKKNQTTLPKAVVDRLGIKPSDQLVYEIEGEHITLRVRSGRLADLCGKYSRFWRKPARRPTQADIDKSLTQHLAEEDSRSKS